MRAQRMRAGVGLLSFSPHVTPPVAPLPLAQPSPADLEDLRAPLSRQPPGGFRGCEFLLATETQLWLKAYRSAVCLHPSPESHPITSTAKVACDHARQHAQSYRTQTLLSNVVSWM